MIARVEGCRDPACAFCSKTLAERLQLARAGGVALADEYAKKGPLG
jgi:hypothetical protein